MLGILGHLKAMQLLWRHLRNCQTPADKIILFHYRHAADEAAVPMAAKRGIITAPVVAEPFAYAVLRAAYGAIDYAHIVAIHNIVAVGEVFRILGGRCFKRFACHFHAARHDFSAAELKRSFIHPFAYKRGIHRIRKRIMIVKAIRYVAKFHRLIKRKHAAHAIVRLNAD